MTLLQALIRESVQFDLDREARPAIGLSTLVEPSSTPGVLDFFLSWASRLVVESQHEPVGPPDGV